MAGSFSKTAYARLPAAVKKLSKEAQTVCIYMRLRKSADQIQRETALPPDRTESLMKEVQRTLICSGSYDIIADPVFVSLDAVDEQGRQMEPAATVEAPENRMMLEEFLTALTASISALEAQEKRILHLYFERQQTGAQIYEFIKQSGLAGQAEPASESEVYYLIERSLKKLLSRMADSTPIGRGTLTVKGLKEILSQTGVQEVA